MAQCPDCEGKGKVGEGEDQKDCSTCGGKGEVEQAEPEKKSEEGLASKVIRTVNILEGRK